MRRTRGFLAVALVLLIASIVGSNPSAASVERPETQSALSGKAVAAAPAAPSAPESPSGLSAPSAADRAAQVQATQTSQVSYGPYRVPAAPPNPDGTHGHAHTGNQFSFGVQKPCTNCYITSMKADLVYPDGRQAGWSTSAQLHHMVMFNQEAGRTDPTCYIGFPFPLGLMFGQRFFASGDERTQINFPAGYGYRIGASGTWNLIWELAGMQDTAQTVNIRMTYEWVPATTAGMTDLEPIWFDVAQCGFSTVSVPAGQSSRAWTWTVNRPGDLVTIGGHIHDGGVNIAITNDTTQQQICDSRAGYGESPLYMDHHGEGHISSMSECDATATRPVATVRNGERVTIRANYDMPAAATDQMGIVMGFVTRG
jgi:hypothetical protein